MSFELSFASKDLRSCCESAGKAERKYGQQVARKLRHRIADLMAAKRIDELLAGNPREINESEMAIDLCDGYRLVFAPGHTNIPLLDSGAVNWSEVSRIKILRIENGND